MSEVTAHAEQLHEVIVEREGKYLTFALGPEEYGLEVLKVREIIGYMDVIAVQQTPAQVKGVLNLRGQVVPVVDLRTKFGMETAEATEQTCIIVVETSQGDHRFCAGIVVDRVQEVLDIAGEDIEEDIEEVTKFGSSINADFILGMERITESAKILLDIDRVLAGTDLGNFPGMD